MERELHIFEEGAYLFWGLVILVSTAGGTYLLTGSFVIDSHWSILRQAAALILFLISFWGIYKVSDSHFHLTLFFEGAMLNILIRKGNLQTNAVTIPVNEIEALKFTSHYPRSSGEALFDFSRSYHLLYRTHTDPTFRRLLDVESGTITLKVDDIADIMRFITERNPGIHIPKEQAEYFNL